MREKKSLKKCFYVLNINDQHNNVFSMLTILIMKPQLNIFEECEECLRMQNKQQSVIISN